tara:strand:- start:2034 stop:2639 length:606 start_codon:yes stop_codon:yes gene_type:complete
MRVIVFDTETTGLPSKKFTLDQQPYVIQFAAVVYEYSFASKSLQEVEQYNWYIKPRVDIPFDSISVHGITNEMVADKPYFEQVAKQLYDVFASCDIAVAHNIEFDRMVLAIEFERAGVDTKFLPSQLFDTMKETKDLCRLPGKLGNYKSPRLSELHTYLFNESFENAHNAIFDVYATGRCLQELLLREVFSIDEPTQDTLF